MSTDPKCWLQCQPNFQHWGYSCDQQSIFEQEADEKRNKCVSGDRSQCTNTKSDLCENTTCHLEPIHDQEAKCKAVKSKSGFCEYCEGRGVLMDHCVSGERLISSSTDMDCVNLEPSWIRVGKTDPWWRVSHEDDLVLLVMQKSLYHIENCDLPPPQKHFGSCDPLFGFGDVYIPYDENSGCENCMRCEQKDSVPRSIVGHNCSFLDGLQPKDSENSHRNFSNGTTTKDQQERVCGIDRDPTNSRLLEALRHSQTRAREAEEAAKESNGEKEHIVKLLFRQASHLFAYKQWFRLLQLENLYFQLKLKDHQPSTVFPVFPSSSVQDNNQFKSLQGKGRKQHGCCICNCILSFVIGFGLAGAGLLLGWSLGCCCLIPS